MAAHYERSRLPKDASLRYPALPADQPDDFVAPRDRQRSFVDFLNLVRGADRRNSAQNQYACQRLLEKDYGTGRVVAKAVMSEMNGLTGGYLLPADYSDALLETVAEESFIYPRATVIPMF